MDYEQIKQKYKDYIVIQKQGIFYIVYDLDAYIISYIFDYQVKLNKVGFPNMGKVLDKLNKLKINYTVINENKKKFKNNNYSKYTLENINKMNKIINNLKNNIPNEEILNKIESII